MADLLVELGLELYIEMEAERWSTSGREKALDPCAPMFETCIHVDSAYAARPPSHDGL